MSKQNRPGEKRILPGGCCRNVDESADGRVVGLAGADADAFLQVQDEDLPVPDVPRAPALDEGVDGGFETVDEAVKV